MIHNKNDLNFFKNISSYIIKKKKISVVILLKKNISSY